MRVVHYLNQFFGGIGGEDKADAELTLVEGPVGPGKALQMQLGQAGTVAATIICGDNTAQEKTDEIADRAVEMARAHGADVLFAGPAFQSGRYGLACAAVVDAAHRAGLPATTGMHPDNPGVDFCPPDAPIIRAGDNAMDMVPTLARTKEILLKIALHEVLNADDRAVCLPRGIRRNILTEKSAAARAVDLLLAKMHQGPFETELGRPRFPPVVPAAPVPEGPPKVALISTGGLVPKGNPDRLKGSSATKWLSYSISGHALLKSDEFETVHAGIDTSNVNADPNRLIPLDVCRDLEAEGIISSLHSTYSVTVGNLTSVKLAERFGREIAAKVRAAQTQAAILTST